MVYFQGSAGSLSYRSTASGIQFTNDWLPPNVTIKVTLSFGKHERIIRLKSREQYQVSLRDIDESCFDSGDGPEVVFMFEVICNPTYVPREAIDGLFPRRQLDEAYDERTESLCHIIGKDIRRVVH
jgi:hypothetical protein